MFIYFYVSLHIFYMLLYIFLVVFNIKLIVDKWGVQEAPPIQYPINFTSKKTKSMYKDPVKNVQIILPKKPTINLYQWSSGGRILSDS